MRKLTSRNTGETIEIMRSSDCEIEGVVLHQGNDGLWYAEVDRSGEVGYGHETAHRAFKAIRSVFDVRY